jgi:dTDP-4-amino-4,6-dideoxygalactose transaminase
MEIPLVDLKKQYISIKNEILNEFLILFDKTNFIQGEYVRNFEKQFADFNKVENGNELFCASCGNGTDALYLALKVLNIKNNDEVISVSHTFIATIEAIYSVGAKPILVDIDEKTMLIDPKKIEEKITNKTKAIIVVHLYGQSCDMEAVCAIAKKYNLKVIEDAAQAHGATWNNIRVGNFGDIACFSFYPGKNLGAYGDAGALISKNKDLIDKARILANHGRENKYDHLEMGVNSRLDSLQAAFLSVKLKYLEKWNKQRQQIAAYYIKNLKNSKYLMPSEHPNAKSVWHLFVIRTKFRDKLIEELKRKKIDSGIHYPTPIHLQKAYLKLGYEKIKLPITEKISSEILSLPIYPELDLSEQNYIIDVLKDFETQNF